MSDAAPLSIPQDTRVRQRNASDPLNSAWVSANAGSGKTHVLTQRVVRLLLAGVPPTRILCLTFTKAAAANMSIRVFETLAHWTTLEDTALRAAITETGAPWPSATDLVAARRLFARTVETPGGLKIQTIHAFCERLLHLFPFEANVPASFEVLDDTRSADLLLRAREAALAEAMRPEGSPLGAAVALLAEGIGGDTFDKLIAEALMHRESLRASPAPDVLVVELAVLVGIDPDETPETIQTRIVEGGIPPRDWAAIARTLGADGGDKRKTGNRLAIVAAASPETRCDAYLDVFLTEGEPRKDSYLVKAFRAKNPDLAQALDDERERVAGLLGRLKAARLVGRTVALVAVAAAVLAHFDTLKRRRGLLDFDDLIERTRTLLKRSDAAWVLYKLDSGIDHILVDEAQDTSPAQWEILSAISDDFFAGAGRSSALRTFFAVGDEKQSIYSFQGARPDMFAAMKRHFSMAATDAQRRFEDVKLLLSFRSARAILSAVDRVFAHPPNAEGLSGDADTPQPHEALRRFPGLVEIWPPVFVTSIEEPRDWRLPVDVVDPGQPPVVLARRIADAIARWTGPGSTETVAEGDGGRRPMRPGDVMILVRARGPIFEALIRALKERKVPVAGADRLALTQHIAVMDLMAAGRAALNPDDDFTLACVLKSPLIGLDDDDLIRLAPGRKESLIEALRASDDARHRAAWRSLRHWQDQAGALTPFDFYMQLLSADGGRRNLLSRLGPEAGDAMDEFVALALAHERDGAPSLLAFLARLQGAELSVKRDMEAAGDAVRVMTVHAAKGLEAKVVILPDTCGAPTGRHDPKLFKIEAPGAAEGPLLWSPRSDADAGPVGGARAAARQRAIEEYHRLLYVAMTRAEERLYVAAFCGEKGVPQGCWYDMIAQAELPLDEVPAFWNPQETVRRLADRGPVEPVKITLPSSPIEKEVLPGWLWQPAPAEAEDEEPPVRPSNPLGAADQFAPVAWSFRDRHPSTRRASLDHDDGGHDVVRKPVPTFRHHALAAGRLMHKLLLHLPDVDPARRREVAARFLHAQASGIEAERHPAMIDQALAVIEDPRLQPLFGAASRAEVAVAATVRLTAGRSIEVAGQIDRIGVTPDAVHIADYKTGRPADDLLPRHLIQLALYRAAVEPLYPGRPVRCHLVWTAGPRAVEIDPAALDEAMAVLAARA